MAETTEKTQESNPKKPRIAGCSYVVLSLLGVMTISLLLYLSLIAVGAILIVSDPLEPVDAVVVLSGGEGDRLALAIEMHERGYAPNLVITDTNRTANARLREEAIEGGFPRESVFITELSVDSTYDEAQAVEEFALSKNWDSLMIVTDPYHSFRTRFIFKRELQDSEIGLLVRPIGGHWFRSTTWFYRAEGWRVVLLEITKFFNYLVVQS